MVKVFLAKRGAECCPTLATNSISSAIMDGIFWKGSIEGSKYWSLIFKELTTGYEYV